MHLLAWGFHVTERVCSLNLHSFFCLPVPRHHDVNRFFRRFFLNRRARLMPRWRRHFHRRPNSRRWRHFHNCFLSWRFSFYWTNFYGPLLLLRSDLRYEFFVYRRTFISRPTYHHKILRHCAFLSYVLGLSGNNATLEIMFMKQVCWLIVKLHPLVEAFLSILIPLIVASRRVDRSYLVRFCPRMDWCRKILIE